MGPSDTGSYYSLTCVKILKSCQGREKSTKAECMSVKRTLRRKEADYRLRMEDKDGKKIQGDEKIHSGKVFFLILFNQKVMKL